MRLEEFQRIGRKIADDQGRDGLTATDSFAIRAEFSCHAGRCQFGWFGLSVRRWGRLIVDWNDR